jgi:hypothetical protein
MRIGKFFLIIYIAIFSTTSFAEYYFVGNSASCNQRYNNKIYKDSGSFSQFSQFSQNKYNKYNNKYIYTYNSHETTYNLDLITGDDDPYTYPGMNIDN